MQKLKKYKIFHCIIAFSLLLLTFSSCNDAPSVVGSGFLSDTVVVDVLAEQDSLAFPSETYLVNTPMQKNTGSILVGDNGEIRAGALMRFGVPTGRNDITVEQIVSCKLFMFPQRYGIGDTAGSNQLNFEIKEVTSNWIDENLAITANDVLNSDKLFNNSRKIAEWSGQIARKDSMDTLTFDFSREICVEWLQKINDGSNITDTVWGIAVLPKSGSTVVNNFMAHSNFSVLTGNVDGAFIRVLYNNSDSELDSFDIKSIEDCSFVKLRDDIAKNEVMIQGGVRVHSRFEFDISQIPKYAGINFAEFVLFVDEEKSYSGNISLPETISLYFYSDFAMESSFGKFDIELTGKYDSTMKAFVFQNSRSDVPFNYFVRNLDGKGKLVLAFQDINQELNYLNRYVFYGSDAKDVSKRPRLRLIYSNI